MVSHLFVLLFNGVKFVLSWKVYNLLQHTTNQLKEKFKFELETSIELFSSVLERKRDGLDNVNHNKIKYEA